MPQRIHSPQYRLCRRAPGAAVILLTVGLVLAPMGRVTAADQVEVDGITVTVTKADCLRLVKHEPDADVLYQPGQDVDSSGEPVASPYLYGQPKIELPETVEIPIEVDLDALYGLPADDSFKGDVQVGRVEVDLKSGRATFNGQPLTSADEARLRAKCIEVLRAEE